MKTYCLKLIVFLFLSTLSMALYAQDGLQIARLFEKYGEGKNITRVELNGEILEAYRMSTYRSLVFENVTAYRDEIQACLKQDALSAETKKRQEVFENGSLLSAYYQLSPIRRKGQVLRRYILFKRGKNTSATLIYIEGELDEKELIDILYRKP